MISDSGRGFRKVVPSPAPLDLLEKDTIIRLFECGTIVISAGGRGCRETKLVRLPGRGYFSGFGENASPAKEFGRENGIGNDVREFSEVHLVWFPPIIQGGV